MTTGPQWRKSSHSVNNGACVEAAAQWVKSSYSTGHGACTEVAAGPDSVLVRDSKDRGGPVLEFSTPEWREFAGRVVAGEFGAGAPHRT